MAVVGYLQGNNCIPYQFPRDVARTIDFIRVPLGNGQQVDIQVPDGHTEGMTFQIAVIANLLMR